MSCFSFRDPQKNENEDLFLPPTFDSEYNIVFAIADGVGSLENSNLTSACAIKSIHETLDEKEFSIEKAFQQAKNNVDKLNSTSATTLTIVHIFKNQVAIGHLGDCRAYYSKNNKLIQITKDHTRYQELLDSGEHSLNKLREHKDRLSNVLTSALSNQTDLKYDMFYLHINDVIENDVINITLMSDGAYRHWDSRPRFSDNTMSSPSAFSTSLRKRVEKDIHDDYTFVGVKVLIK